MQWRVCGQKVKNNIPHPTSAGSKRAKACKRFKQKVTFSWRILPYYLDIALV